MERQCFIDRVKNSGEFESLVQNDIVMKWLRFYDNFVCVCVLNIHCSLTPVSEFRISTLERCSKEWANTQNVGQRAIGMRYSTDVLMILLLSNNLHSVYKMCNDGCTVKAPCPSANILISLKIKRTKKKKKKIERTDFSSSRDRQEICM